MLNRIERRHFLKTAAEGFRRANMAAVNKYPLSINSPAGHIFEFEGVKKMEDKTLITYASRYGSTAEIAQRMAKIIRSHGESVDVIHVEQAKDLSAYKHIIVGSAVQNRQWLPEAVCFVKINRMILRRISTAYFTICMTMAEDNDANRHIARGFLEPVYQYNHADLEGFFGGHLDYETLSWTDRKIMESHRYIKEGDYRNWNAIRTWTENVYLRLIA